MNSYPQAQDGGNKFVEGLATGGLLAGLGYFSLNPKRRAEARQKIANLVNPNAKSATAGTRQGDLVKANEEILGRAQAVKLKQEVPVEQVPASPPGALVKPSSSPSDLLARTVDEVSVKILDDPQPQIPGGSLGQGILTSYPTTSQRKAAYDAAAAKPVSELPAVTRPSSGVDVELITDPVTGEKFAPGRSPAGTTPRDYLESQNFVPANTMVDQQDARVGLQVDQSVAAINAAEDQATGRVMRRLQANEDLDIGAVNAAKEQAEAVLEDTISRNPELASNTPLDAAANSVARSLPDGAPIDQAETGARMTSQGLVEQAKQEMTDLRGQAAAILREKTGVEPSPARVENQMARMYVANRGATGRALENVSTETPQLNFEEPLFGPDAPVRQNVDVKGSLVGTSTRQPESLDYLPERTVLNIGPDARVQKTAAGTAVRGASPVMDTAKPKEQTRPVFGSSEPLVPGAPDERMPDRPASETTLQQILSAPLPRIDDYAENIDRGVTAGGIGVYGREPGFVPGAVGKATGEYSAAAQRKPTDLPFKEAPSGGAKFSDLSSDQLKSFIERAPEGNMKQAGLDEARRRENTAASLQASEALRRARIEGRDPQSVLRDLGFGV